MKFIFPQNYNFANKILGFFDYSTAIFLVCWCAIVGAVLHILIPIWTLKIVLFIVLCFPLVLFSIVGFNNENIVYVLNYLVRFAIKQKVLMFKKSG